jgi:hypothetical protein
MLPHESIETIVFSLFLMMKDLVHTTEAQGKQSERLLI